MDDAYSSVTPFETDYHPIRFQIDTGTKAHELTDQMRVYYG